MYWYGGIPLAAAPVRQIAIQTAKIALASDLDWYLPHSFLVQSSTSTKSLSILFMIRRIHPHKLRGNDVVDVGDCFEHTLVQPLSLVVARSSKASQLPVAFRSAWRRGRMPNRCRGPPRRSD